MAFFSTTTKTQRIARHAPLIPSVRCRTRACPTPLQWSEVPDCDPARFHGAYRARAVRRNRRSARAAWTHSRLARESLLELAAKRRGRRPRDAPWPPHFRKMEGEAPRVAPSRAKVRARKSPAAKPPRTKMPLMVVANSPNKAARWRVWNDGKANTRKRRLLAVDDVLVDSMRGRSSTWTRIRVNLRNVPEALRPRRKRLIPDDDPDAGMARDASVERKS